MIKILGDRVLVLLEPRPPDVVTESGIVLMRDPDARQVPTRGIVAQLGAKRTQVELADVKAALFEMTYSGGILDSQWRDVEEVLDALRPAPFDVAVGDCVIFAPGDGEEVEFDGQTYVILREAEILGVVEAVTT